VDIDDKCLDRDYRVMSKNWLPRMASVATWLRTPQPRSGERGDRDADSRRARADLDAIRARFPDHA